MAVMQRSLTLALSSLSLLLASCSGSAAGDSVAARAALDDEKGIEVTRYSFGARLREIVQHQDGSIWVLEDGPQARLLKLAPR